MGLGTHTMLWAGRAVGMLALLCSMLALVSQAAFGCRNDDECLQLKDPALWRCVVQTNNVSNALPCTVDAGFNKTGLCACGTQPCIIGNYSEPTGIPQYLVIGDSVSMGYFPYLHANLSSTLEAFHAPGNNDNTNWGDRCVEGWLGTDPLRWDVISLNFGLHDLANPDNEHISVDTYSAFLKKIIQKLQQRTRAKLLWVSTTPVPTDPPPQKGANPAGEDNCTLVPGRLEVDVIRYNTAAAAVAASAGVHTCDLHTVIEERCGQGYGQCDIAQCGGPHFQPGGFRMLGEALAKCAMNIVAGVDDVRKMGHR